MLFSEMVLTFKDRIEASREVRHRNTGKRIDASHKTTTTTSSLSGIDIQNRRTFGRKHCAVALAVLKLLFKRSVGSTNPNSPFMVSACLVDF